MMKLSKRWLMACAAVMLAFVLSGCRSGPMAGVNIDDYERAEGQYPNLPAILDAVKRGQWNSATNHGSEFDIDEMFEDINLTYRDGHTGHFYDLSGSYKQFGAVSLTIFRSQSAEKNNEGYMKIKFDCYGGIRYKIDEEGTVHSEATGLDLGDIGSINVQERLQKELEMKQEYLPYIIGYDEQDAYELLEQLGIPRSTLIDIKQVYRRSPGTSVIPSLTGEPLVSYESNDIWSGGGSYDYTLRASYEGNGYPVAMELNASQNYLISRDDFKKVEGLDPWEQLTIRMPESSISITFYFDNDFGIDLNVEEDGPEGNRTRSQKPFTNNDTYPYNFTDVAALANLL